MTLIINNEHNFKERKKDRADYYHKYIFGWRQQACTACNGSGYYDHDGNPDCDACSGTGKELYKTDLDMIKSRIGDTLQYIREHDDDRMLKNTAIRIYIKNTRSIIYQFVDLGGVIKTRRQTAKLEYGYNWKTENYEWLFEDIDGNAYFLSEFETI